MYRRNIAKMFGRKWKLKQCWKVVLSMLSSKDARVAQLVRAPSLYLGGPWFESMHAHKDSKTQSSLGFCLLLARRSHIFPVGKIDELGSRNFRAGSKKISVTTIYSICTSFLLCKMAPSAGTAVANFSIVSCSRTNA